jgi:hypothetical protein
MGEHGDPVGGQRVHDVDDLGVGERHVLEERVQLDRANPVVPQRGDVFLG